MGDDTPIGRTYNTSIKANVGDILKAEFVNLSQYTDPDSEKIWFNWWSPHVILLRSDKKQPDSVATAKKLVEASHGEIKPRRTALIFHTGKITLIGFNSLFDLFVSASKLESIIARVASEHPEVLGGA